MKVSIFIISVLSFVTICTANYNTSFHDTNRLGDETLNYVSTYLGGCSKDEQCEWLGDNSGCYHYHCMCKDGYRWYQGSCRKYAGLGQDCTNSLDCYDGYNPLSLSCTNGKCVCADDHYNRDNIDCRKIATKKNDLCALNIDCHFENSICDLGKCTTTKVKRVENEYIEQTYFMGFNEETKTCTTDTDCGSIENSECYSKTSKCACKRGYFFNSNGSTCIAEIGMNVGCKTDKDCKIKPGKCLNGTCYCRDYYFTADGNQNCVKSISENNWNCLSKEWCNALGPYSYCNSDGKCSCSKIADYDKTNEICVKQRDDPNICRTALECQDKIKNSICLNEVCTCEENYRDDNGNCMPDIGGKCDEEYSCTLDNSHCDYTKGVCECNINCTTAEITGNTKCYKISDGIGNDCEVNEQCSAVNVYSTCKKNRCSCIDDYSEKQGKCYQEKEYKSYCTNRLECSASLGETFYCRNSMCQCYTSDIYDKGICKSSAVINIVNYILLFVIILNFFGSILS